MIDYKLLINGILYIGWMTYMKLYLVIERNSNEEFNDLVFGIFSTREKAIEIKDFMNQNFAEHDEEYVAEIIELELDKPTEDYEFFIYN